MFYLQETDTLQRKQQTFRDTQKQPAQLTCKVGFYFWQSQVYFFPHHLCSFLHYENGESGIARVRQGHLLFQICSQALSILPSVPVLLVWCFRSPSFCCLFQTRCFPRPSLQLNSFLPILLLIFSISIPLLLPPLFSFPTISLFHSGLTPPVALLVSACLSLSYLSEA